MSNMFYILGASLAQAIGKEEILCRGVLRMTVMNSIQHLRQMNDPIQASKATVAYMTIMNYRDWKAIIEGPALSNNLKNIGIGDASAITAQLTQTLVEQQSLFTMAAQ